MKITRKMKRSITKILVLIFVSLMTGATPAFAQKLTTYWMGRRLPNDSKIHFDVKVPDFFAKWIDELKPKTVTHQINGKEWEITTLTLKWDENGSSPKRTGQIQFEGFGDMSWKQHATAQWGPFADQLYAMKSPAEGSWFSVKDINFIKSDADPQLTAAMNLPRTASDNKHPKDLSYNFTKVPEIIAVASGDNTVDVAWRTTGTDPEVYVGRYRVNPTGATTLISPTPVGLGEGYRYLAGFTRDSDGSLYVLRAKRDAPIWNKQHPEKVDRTDVMVLTKFDKNFKLIYKNKPLGTAGKSRSGAIYAPMAVEFNSDANPLGGQEDGTSRIAWTNYGGKSVIFAYYSCLTEYDGGINRRHQNSYYRVLDATTGDPVPDYNRDSFGHTMATDLLASDDGVISVGRNDTGLFLANHLKYATQDRDPRVFVFNHVWNGNDSFSELGMLASAEAEGYLLLFTSNHSHGKPFGIDFGNQAKAISDFNEQIGHSRDLVLVRVAKSFADDSLQSGKRTEVVFGFPDLENIGNTATPDSIFKLRTSDKYKLVPTDGLRFRYLTKYAEETGEYSASRPKIIALSSNKFVVLWESWTMVRGKDDNGQTTINGNYDSTWAMMIDMNGNELVPAKKLSGTESLRLNSGDDAFLMDGKASWVNGNGSALVLHTVDSQLGYKAVRLP